MGLSAEDFREVILQHQSMVYSIALRITCDPGTAEEVAQDAFLALHRQGGIADADHLRFWLRRVTTHGAIDALRKQARQPESGAEEWVEDDHAGVRFAARTAGLEAKVEDLLHALPEASRVAVTLRYGEGMLPEEIAELLKQPLGTVKSNLQRGLALLRRKADATLKEYVR